MDNRLLTVILAGALVFACAAVMMTGTVQEPHTLPSAYDLRDVDGKCFITPVKMQGGTLPDGQPDVGNLVGSCWAFSACAAFESSLLVQGYVSDPTSPAANLSVWHMANYNGYNHPVYAFNPDPIPNYTLPFGYTESEPVIRGWAGDHRYAIDYLISGRGPVLNSYAPFPLDDIQEKRVLTPPPENLPVSYMLREALIFSRPDYATDEEFQELVKQALMEYGALLSFQYTHPSMYPGTEETPIFNRSTGDYYFNGTGDDLFPASLNHAVTIAGWDDKRVIRGAPGPGAWLIKNSLGTELGDEGYIWLSYHDAMFLKGYDFAVAFIADGGPGSGHRYETFAGALSNVSSEPYEIAWDYLSDGFAEAGGESWACARFTAEEDASLRSVGFMTLNRNENVTVAVYGGWDEAGARPDPAGLLLSEMIPVPERGYHLIDLSREIPLEAGDEFVIAVGFAEGVAVADFAEPLVYVTANSPPPGRTYRSSSDPREGWGGWEDYSELHNGSVFFVQGFAAAK